MVSNSLCSTHLGALAELRARKFLEELGFEFVEKNFRFRGGEIDLVMLDKRTPAPTLVFVEVRSVQKSSPWLKYSIHFPKQLRIQKTAYTYLLKRPHFRKLPKRFDIVWITGEKLEHWKNAIS